MNERNKISKPAFVRLRSLTLPTPNKRISGFGLRIHSNPRYARTSDTRQPLSEIPKPALGGVLYNISKVQSYNIMKGKASEGFQPGGVKKMRVRILGVIPLSAVKRFGTFEIQCLNLFLVTDTGILILEA